MKLTLKHEPFALPLVIGSVVAIIGNALHPRTAEETSPAPYLTAHLIQDGRSVWFFSHGILLLAIALMTIGFVGLFRYLYQREKNYSLVGLVMISIWSILSVFVFMMDGFVGVRFADMPHELFEYNYYFALTITVVSFLVFGSAIAAYNISAIKAKVFSYWLNWLGILIGLVTLVGYPLGMFGVYMVYSPAFPFYAGIAALWSLLVGLQLMNARSSKSR